MDETANRVGGANEQERAARLLELDDVRLRSASGDAAEGVHGSLRVAAGEIVMVQAPRPRQSSLLADACAGIVTPDDGAIRFLGHDWRHLDIDDSNALRALLGRVFFAGHWLDHLDMSDNILLAHLHHTRRARDHLLHEAARLARHFGLPGLPFGSPHGLDRSESQRAACVRAFLGAPRLIVLEHPTSGVFPQILPALVNAARAACARGAAVVWFTPSEVVWRDASIPVTRRVRIARNQLVAAGAGP